MLLPFKFSRYATVGCYESAKLLVKITLRSEKYIFVAGDSGGPLVCQRCENCDWYLVGITAFGRECAREGFYGVFTRTRSYESWITEITSQQFVSAEKTCTKACKCLF